MHNLETNMARLSKKLRVLLAPQLNKDLNLRLYPHKPKMCDLHILALALAAEAMLITSQNLLYSKIRTDYPRLFARLPDRSNYNRRLRALSAYIDLAAVAAKDDMLGQQDTFIVDSMPLPVCHNARISWLKIMSDDATLAPARGYSAPTQGYIFGYKLHVLSTPSGLIINHFITPANVHDVSQLPESAYGQMSHARLPADKGYTGRRGQLDLFEQDQVEMIVPDKSNAKEPQNLWNKSYSIIRKRIETLFSQLTDQFTIKSNYAKTTRGYISRIRLKITALTLLQHINFMAGKPIGHIKHALAT